MSNDKQKQAEALIYMEQHGGIKNIVNGAAAYCEREGLRSLGDLANDPDKDGAAAEMFAHWVRKGVMRLDEITDSETLRRTKERLG